MFFRTLAPLITIAVAFSGCSGGGTSGTSSSAELPATAPQLATGTLTVGTRSAGAAGTVRRPAYVSAGTTFATLWIDANAGNRVACAPGAGGTCTINWVSTSGTHTFVVEVDNSATLSGPGTVLADYSTSENLIAGSNSLPNVTLNGVAAQVAFLSNIAFAANSPTCNANIGLPLAPACLLIYYQILDAGGNVIVPPGTWAFGGVCWSVSGNLAFRGQSCTSAIIANDYGAEACNSGATGNFSLTFASSSPSSAAVSVAQLSTYALSYPNQSAYVLTNWPTYSCTNGVIAANGPANGSLTVQSGAH